LNTDASSHIDPTTPGRRRHWLLEPQVLVLVLLVLGVYFTRLESLTIRGEETRRATIAAEMIASGDWIVPTQQGEPYLTRPPLQNWAIALVGMVTGGTIDELAVRLPSVIAVLLTTLLVYGYARTFLNRLGSIASATAFATFGQILELGRLGETDALLTLCVGGSLLLWHGGWMRRRPAAWCWTAGYGMAALGLMVKGPQAPVYFAGPVAAYLLATRQGRHLLRWPHFAGIAVFVLIIAPWLLPFAMRTGLEGVVRIFSTEVGIRFDDLSIATFLSHLVSFPVEILFGGLLPWSVLLIAYADPRFRRSLGAARAHALFLAITVAVTFPTLWLIPGAETRLYVSLFPAIAPLVGLVVQRCHESVPAGLWEKLWRPFAVCLAVIAAVIATTILATAWMDPAISPLIQPPVFAVAFALAVAGGSALVVWTVRRRSPPRGQVGMVVIAAFAGLVYTGAVTTARINDSVDAAETVAMLRKQLPVGSRMISFGPVHHLFSYHYRDPIELRDWPSAAAEIGPEVRYFCFDADTLRDPLPIAWEKIIEISCDRSRHDDLRARVIVARRLGAMPGRSPTGIPGGATK
jgi:4-amino-4-deoxy-L-arabinose transferase-like glycosyltransferase